MEPQKTSTIFISQDEVSTKTKDFEFLSFINIPETENELNADTNLSKTQIFNNLESKELKYKKVNLETNVFDVSALIIKILGPISALKLQKLVYYCQAWSLVWDDKPIFKERIEAWANGPVVPELYAFHRGQYEVSSVQVGNFRKLSQTQTETVQSVVSFYGNKSGKFLIDLTHSEAPWIESRSGLGPMERGNREILLSTIAEYYGSLKEE